MSTEPQEIAEEQAEKFNRQACEMVHIFFKELASIPADEIYKIGTQSQEDKGSTILLEAINRTFTQFLENGEGLNRIYFDSYERTVDGFINTFKVNIKNKLEQNNELLLAQAVGKKSNDISYTDIENAIVNVEVETAPEVETAA